LWKYTPSAFEKWTQQMRNALVRLWNTALFGVDGVWQWLR
jgi:hypothetical protein